MMSRKIYPALLMTLLVTPVSCRLRQDGSSPLKGIIGNDDRKEFYEVSERLKTVTRATFALIDKSFMEIQNDGSFKFSSKVKTYQKYGELCSGVRFSEQPAAADCSGFLAADTSTGVTAGHCFPTSKTCDQFYVVFDFHLDAPRNHRTSFAKEQVFSCASIVKKSDEPDFAVFKLARPAVDRIPLIPRRGGVISVDTPVTIIGHPHGLPVKIAGGARVTQEGGNADPAHHFEATIDAFGGNSGSAVINDQTHEVEGIHVVGFASWDEETDPTTRKVCNRPAQRSEQEATPAWVTRISWVLPFLMSDLPRL